MPRQRSYPKNEVEVVLFTQNAGLKKSLFMEKHWDNLKDHSLHALDVITKNLQNQNPILLQSMLKLVKLTNQKEGLITCTQLN